MNGNYLVGGQPLSSLLLHKKRGRPKGKKNSVAYGSRTRPKCVDCSATIHHGSIRCRSCNDAAQRVGRSTVKRICEGCGAAFLKNTRRGTKEGNRYCARKCAFRSIEDWHTPRRVPRSLKVWFGSCDVCGCRFTARRPNARTCSPHCSARLHQYRAVERNVRICKQCYSVFVPEYGSKRRVFCSTRCAHRAADLTSLCMLHTPAMRAKVRKIRKQRIRDGESIVSVDIFERDGWKCRICNRPVDRAAKHPEHLAPTIDHIVPFALGGPHTKDNVQCAHFICNVRKAMKIL